MNIFRVLEVLQIIMNGQKLSEMILDFKLAWVLQDGLILMPIVVWLQGQQPLNDLQFDWEFTILQVGAASDQVSSGK